MLARQNFGWVETDADCLRHGRIVETGDGARYPCTDPRQAARLGHHRLAHSSAATHRSPALILATSRAETLEHESPASVIPRVRGWRAAIATVA
jgi:hypothetical protein